MMLKKFLIFTLIVSCSAAIFAQDDYKAKYNAAYKLYRSKKYAEAIPAFTKLAEETTYPSNKFSCYIHAGYSARNLKKYDEAIAFAKKASKVKNPYVYDGKTRIIDFMYNGKKYKEITETITADEILEWPKYYRANVLNLLGLAQYNLKNGEDAEKTFEIMYKNAETDSYKGLALMRSGHNYRHRLKNTEKAVEAYNKAIEVPKASPNYKAEAYDGLAGLLVNQKKYDEAVAEYDKALKLKLSGYWKARSLYGKGNALKSKGDTDDAIKCYKQSIAVKGAAGWTKKACNNQLKKLEAK
jgi:tetratricopeptide (TPR) repeat protein